MQRCEKCNTKFKWIEIFRYQWRWSKKNNTLLCRQCNTEHELSASSRLIIMPIFTLLTLIVVFYIGGSFPNKSIFFYLFITFLASTIVLTLSPFVLKLHSKYHSNFKANP